MMISSGLRNNFSSSTSPDNGQCAGHSLVLTWAKGRTGTRHAPNTTCTPIRSDVWPQFVSPSGKAHIDQRGAGGSVASPRTPESAARFQVPRNPSPAYPGANAGTGRRNGPREGCGLGGEVVAEHVGAGVGNHLAGFDRLRVACVRSSDHLDHGRARGQVEG